MKYTFQWILAAVCFLVVGNSQVMADGGEEGDIVSIPISTGKSFTGSDQRGVLSIPFTAYYQGGTIYISTFAEFSSIAVSVVNETTNQVWNSTTDIFDGMGEISIANGGVGNYSVEIVTEYGEIFVGILRL